VGQGLLGAPQRSSGSFDEPVPDPQHRAESERGEPAARHEDRGVERSERLPSNPHQDLGEREQNLGVDLCLDLRPQGELPPW
jgi:hypothetical protein